MIDKHGLNIVGLKKLSAELQNTGDNSRYYELFYNERTGEVWANYHCSLGRNSWTRYEDEDVMFVCFTSEHMTMQEIADKIYFFKKLEEWRGEDEE